MSKVTIHMVSSLDGYIAKHDDSVEWMHSKDTYENGKELTEEYIAEFLKSIDCYVMGSKTFEHAQKLGWPYGDVPVVVLTKRDLKTDKLHVEFRSGDLKSIMTELKSKYKNIWMVGGTEATKVFLQQNLADELVVTIVPVLLGSGKPFFDQINVEKRLHLLDVSTFTDGMVEMTYQIQHN